MPIPIVLTAGAWRFDTEEGVDELANQRIGGNELRTIETMRAYVAAQNDYASADRDGDEVLEYAQHISSSAGRQDGLYWPTSAGEAPSPLGPLLAAAVETHDVGDSYNGYYYRILTEQGANPPGGAYDYVINGNMIAGFALVAWPAEYDQSGIMTFLVNHQGRVFEKDLGPDTAAVVAAIDDLRPRRNVDRGDGLTPTARFADQLAGVKANRGSERGKAAGSWRPGSSPRSSSSTS